MFLVPVPEHVIIRLEPVLETTRARSVGQGILSGSGYTEDFRWELAGSWSSFLFTEIRS